MGLHTRTDLPVGMQSEVSYLLQTSAVPRIRSAVDSNRSTEESYCKNSPTSLLYFLYYSRATCIVALQTNTMIKFCVYELYNLTINMNYNNSTIKPGAVLQR
jgi:hypothetical protein